MSKIGTKKWRSVENDWKENVKKRLKKIDIYKIKKLKI